MRLARHGPARQENPIVAGSDGVWRDLSSLTHDVDARFLSHGLGAARAALESASLPPITSRIRRFGPPPSSVGKIICIGLNYVDHARETGAALPDEPVMFLKTPDTVIGPDDDVLVPRRSTETDWEVELAVVMGAPVRYLESPDQAAHCIAGFAISNDVSEREFQMQRGGQWDKGKNCETFNSLGPWIARYDEEGDPQNFAMRLWVNGTLRQNGNTSNMIFGVSHLVWCVSQFLVLRPGDVINTRTPPGVALGLADHPYLRAGDVMEVQIEGLGSQRQVMGVA
jgi:2-keto-4-pentenoate hydratase/2-oxohepta-3-ene-1,7-dioic acid hydratase in catechol pathway